MWCKGAGRHRDCRADRTRTRRHICSCLGRSGASSGIKSRVHKSNSAAIEASWKHEGGYPDGPGPACCTTCLVALLLASTLWTHFVFLKIIICNPCVILHKYIPAWSDLLMVLVFSVWASLETFNHMLQPYDYYNIITLLLSL